MNQQPQERGQQSQASGSRKQQQLNSIFPPKYANKRVSADSSDSEYDEDTPPHQCDNPDCQMNADYEPPIIKNFFYFLKKYYILSIFVILILCLNEEVHNPKTYLHNQARMMLDMPNFQEFLIGNYKPMGHQKEIIEECPNNMTFKEFMTQLIRDYQPCVFRDLAAEWPAIQKWTNHTYLKEAAGNQTIGVCRKKPSDRWAEFGKEFSKPLMTFEDFLDKYPIQTKKKSDFSYFIEDEEPFNAISEDFIEPNVTQQILILDQTTFSIGKAPRNPAQYKRQDQITCVVQGRYDFTIVPPWERFLIEAGGKSNLKEVSTIIFAKHDSKKHPKFDDATNPAPFFDIQIYHPYVIQLKVQIGALEGDCIYVPAYWWVQTDSQSDSAITLTHWYQISSEWLRLVFQGIEKGYI